MSDELLGTNLPEVANTNTEQPESATESKEEETDLSTTYPELPAFGFVEDASFAITESDKLRAELESSSKAGVEILRLVDLPEDLSDEARAEIEQLNDEMNDVLEECDEEAATEISENSTDFRTGLREDGVYDTEHPNTPPEIKEKVFENGISLMREVLQGIDGYSVFASTAMYLQGEKAGREEFMVTPGDFDAVVHTKEDLIRIKERFSNIPGFTKIESDLALADGAEAFSGEIIMQVETEDGLVKANYPVEFFYKSFIVDQNVYRHTEKVKGINVLTMEGLHNQYAKNLEFEKRVRDEVHGKEKDGKRELGVAGFLLLSGGETPDKQPLPDISGHLREQIALPQIESPLAIAIMMHFGLTKEALQDFYAENDKMVKSGLSAEENEESIAIASKILSGFKTKIPKRAKNLRELKAATRIGIPNLKTEAEVETHEEEPPIDLATAA